MAIWEYGWLALPVAATLRIETAPSVVLRVLNMELADISTERQSVQSFDLRLRPYKTRKEEPALPAMPTLCHRCKDQASL